MCIYGAALASVIVGSRRIGVRAGDKVLLCCASSVTDDEFTKYYTSKNTSSEETSLKIVSRSEPKSQ